MTDTKTTNAKAPAKPAAGKPPAQAAPARAAQPAGQHRMMNVQQGKLRTPIRALVYGPEGVGKTSFGADAPKPIFLGAERGTEALDVPRFPMPATLSDVHMAIELLRRGIAPFDRYSTLVVDTLDWLEPLVVQAVCREGGVNTLEKYDGGYGKGYARVMDLWRELIAMFDGLQGKRGMHLVFLAHSIVGKHKSPTGEEYMRYKIALPEAEKCNVALLWRSFVQDLIFCNFEVRVEGKWKRVANATGKRLMYTTHSAAYDAKNRYGLPAVLPLSFSAYWAARERALAAGAATIDPGLIEEAQAALEQLPPDMRKNAKGFSLLDVARKGGAAVLRKLINWAVAEADRIAEESQVADHVGQPLVDAALPAQDQDDGDGPPPDDAEETVDVAAIASEMPADDQDADETVIDTADGDPPAADDVDADPPQEDAAMGALRDLEADASAPWDTTPAAAPAPAQPTKPAGYKAPVVHKGGRVSMAGE